MSDPPAPADEEAFERLVAPYRGELLAHCYRMLGSVQDAEDALQESLLRAWRSLGTLDDRGLLRAWLYRITTNRCLSAIEQRGRRALPIDLDAQASGAEILWLEPYPGSSPETTYLARESIEVAFVAALQHLSAGQRAALILREVLGFSAAEVAGLLETSTAAVNSAVQRARRALSAIGPSQRDVLDGIGTRGVEEIAARWGAAWENGDVDAIVAMLTGDARYSMPPLPQWYRGTEQIRAFLIGGPLLSRWRFLPTTANGQLAFGTYLWDDESGSFVPGGLDVLRLQGSRVAEIVAFLDADLTRFGLPPQLPA